MTELHDQDPTFDEILLDDDVHQRDQDPEPPDDDQEPLDVDAARSALTASRDESCVLGPNGMAALDALPTALDEVVELRRELAYWRGLPMREEYVVTERDKPGDTPDTGGLRCNNAREADAFAGNSGRMWVRSVTEHPWQELSADAPF